MTASPATVEDEMLDVFRRVLVDPLRWLGDDVVAVVAARLDDVVPDLARLLATDGDEAARATGTVLAVMAADGGPPPPWWRTALGKAVARHAYALPIGERAVRAEVAAEMLGVNRSRVYQLASNEQILVPHPDGGLRMSSVLRRAAGLPPEG